MAEFFFKAFLLFLFINGVKNRCIYATPDMNEEKIDIKSHLRYKSIVKMCSNRESACDSDEPNICAVRILENITSYKDCTNICYLFMSNMCDFPGEEYYAVQSGTCEDYLASRRNEKKLSSNKQPKEKITSIKSKIIKITTKASVKTKDIPTTKQKQVKAKMTAKKPSKQQQAKTSLRTTKPTTKRQQTKSVVTTTTKATTRRQQTKNKRTAALRNNTVTTTQFSLLYEAGLVSHDGHPCPFSCTHVYSPVCIVANRGFGKSLKMMHFKNHCESDAYYCKHWEYFSPPPTDEPGQEPLPEMIDVSPLSWSHCGSNRYIQFARFSESASALGHYGWLVGKENFRDILEVHERRPGHG